MRARLSSGPALFVVLAGIWTTATHLPLLGAVSSDSVDAPAAAWHLLPSVVVMLAGSVAVWLAMRGESG